MAGPKRNILILLVLGWLTSLTVGCGNLRVPAIDPSGQQILLPPPSYTTFDMHQKRSVPGPSPQVATTSQGRCCFAKPTYAAPPEIPPCEEPPMLPNADACPPLPDCVPQEVYQPVSPRVVVPGACEVRPEQGEGYAELPQDPSRDYREKVVLTTRRQIAPVGSEVIVVGGVCDEEGYYRIREPLEWTLSQGSVGHFTEAGNPSVGWMGLRGHLASLQAEPVPELCSNNYAVSVSSRRVQVLTRGTAAPNDDLFVLEGQGWIGVTSPNEGNTYVTLSAPELDGWEQRQEMAVIHWIDGQWTLPKPIVAPDLQPQVLTTTVNRRLSASPVQGWIVRYEIAGGVPTTLDGGATTREVVTDATGKASVRVLPPSTQGGATQIRVQVIRPGGTDGAPERFVVGDGTTTVTWSTAQLQVRLVGPESLELNQTANYQVEVVNTGNIAVNNVLVHATAPMGFDYVASSPPGQVSANRVDWMVVQLAPGQQQKLDVSYRVGKSGDAKLCVSAEAAGISPVENCLTAQVTADALYIEMLGPNPDVPLAVGQEANYRVTITNRGDRRLEDVLVVDRFDAGLQHREGTSPIEWPLGAIDPGQSQQLGLSFVVAAPGRHCHTLEATADGTLPARTTACVTAQPPLRTELAVRKTGPVQTIVGRQETFSVTIQNTGDVPLSNLQIVDNYDAEMRPIGANPPAASIEQNRVTWYLSQLAPGQTLTYDVTCQAVFDTPRSCHQVIVRAAGGLERTDQGCVQVGSPTPAGLPPNANALPPRLLPNGVFGQASPKQPAASPVTHTASMDSSAGLELSIDGRGDQWQVGDRINYLIVIRNPTELADSDATLTVRLSPSLKLQSYSGPVNAATSSPNWRTLRMLPLRTLRAGETVQFNVIATVIQPGELLARAELTSERCPDSVAEEDSSVAIP